jgi:Putative Ig domain
LALAPEDSTLQNLGTLQTRRSQPAAPKTMRNPPHQMRLPLLLTLLLAACGGSNSDSPAADLFAGYSTDSLDVPILLAIDDLTPEAVAPSVTGFSVDPALPAGLDLDVDTGVISGIPTELAAAAEYTITATDGTETEDFVLTLSVREPVVSISASRPLIRSVDASGVTIAPGGTAAVATDLGLTLGSDPSTLTQTPNPASLALVDLENVPGSSTSLPSPVHDATADFLTFIAIIDAELSDDPWEFDVLAPYDSLTAATPSFAWDTSVVAIEDDSVTVQYELPAEGLGPLETNSIPTVRLEYERLTNPLLAGADTGRWTVLDGVLYGTIEDFLGNDKLYAYDPAGPALTQVTDTCGSSVNEAPVVLGTFGGSLAISVLNNAVDQHRELFLFDPAGPSLTQIADVLGNASDLPEEVLEVDGSLFFTAATGTGSRGLFRYTPGAPGTVEPISTGSSNLAGDDPQELTRVGDLLFFTANSNGNSERGLFRFNPANSDLDQLTGDFNAGPDNLTEYDGELYVSCETSTGGRKLFRFDELSSRLVQLVDIQGAADLNDGADDFFVNSDDIYFTALRPTTLARKLHRYQPLSVPLRAEQISNVAGSANSDDLSQFTVAGTEVFFVGDTPDGAPKLWSFNDATGEVRQVININDTGISDDPDQLTAFGAKLALVLDTDGLDAEKLFVYDTVSKGIVQALDTNGAGTSDNVQIRAAIGSILYFTADDGLGNIRLYSIE